MSLKLHPWSIPSVLTTIANLQQSMVKRLGTSRTGRQSIAVILTHSGKTLKMPKVNLFSENCCLSPLLWLFVSRMFSCGSRSVVWVFKVLCTCFATLLYGRDEEITQFLLSILFFSISPTDVSGFYFWSDLIAVRCCFIIADRSLEIFRSPRFRTSLTCSLFM